MSTSLASSFLPLRQASECGFVAGRDLDYQQIGARLRLARIRADLTQVQVGVHLGVSEATYSRYEAGERRISIPDLRKAARFMRVSLGEVLDPPSESRIRESEASYSVLPNALLAVQVTQSFTGAGPGTIYADTEYIGFPAPPDIRGHLFVAVPVRGDCLAPRINDGEIVVIDRDALPVDGNIVAARHDHEEILRLWSGGQLLSFNSHPPIVPDARTEIVGVVVGSYRRNP